MSLHVTSPLTPAVEPLSELRTSALVALAECNPQLKVALTCAIAPNLPVNTSQDLKPVMGRPAAPELVHPRLVPSRGTNHPVGRGMLLHALAHIEFNAINLALDAITRFSNMPEAYYRDWLKVAQEEALHHNLLCERLAEYGLSYGHYPAHDGLWQMAEKTQHSLLARMALVPRLLEARGLDVSPTIRDKLIQSGDQASAQVLEVILRDEIGHVAIGNRWFSELCAAQSLDPIEAFEQCLEDYIAPSPRAPFNFEARRMAGFSEAEIQWLLCLQDQQLTS